MDQKEILKHVDHTLLLQGATWDEIRHIRQLQSASRQAM